MSDTNMTRLTDHLSKADLNSQGVSFQGKSLKLNTSDDCKHVIEEIKRCKKLEYLNLEGNTVGVEAAKAISKALETKGELKRALWNDMFTGRMKEEIPKALEFLGKGLTIAGAQLTELNLSDNAFGPIGVSGLASILSSPACYQLQELKLNNNGLGTAGAKMLAKALLQCHTNSANNGKALALKLLVIGRNRLENEGAIALAEVFETLGSLEEISMPQNGIYHKGIKALSNSFKNNANLKVLDLNDNTLTLKGANHIAKALPHLQKLKVLNLGDCLLKNEGATILATALNDKHTNLEELHLNSNEIKSNGGLAVAKAMKNKGLLKKLNMNGNQFGKDGISQLKENLKKSKKIEALETLSEDEGDVSDNENCNEEEEEEEEEKEEEDDDDEEENESFKQDAKPNGSPFSPNKSVKAANKFNLSKMKPVANLDSSFILSLNDLSIKAKPTGPLKEFLDNPTEENLSKIKENDINEFIDRNQDYSVAFFTESFIPLLVKVSSFSSSDNEVNKKLSLKVSQNLYKTLFEWASKSNQISTVNNAIFVYFDLIKSEDKNFKIDWNVKSCLISFNKAIAEGAVPKVTQDVLKVLMEKKSNKQNNEEIVIT